MGQFLGQLHQLVVVSREHRSAADRVVEVFRHRPRYGDAIIRRGSATDLIQQHQAPFGRAMEDGAGLAHFDHEGGLPAGQVVARADSGKEPVRDADFRSRRGHERAELGHYHREPYLPQDGGLAGHVGSRDQQHPFRRFEPDIVGNEGFPRHQPLDHRMTAGSE